MTNTLRLKTNLNCNSCVAAVKPYLDREPSISKWQVDLAAPEKTLTVEGEPVSTDNVKAALAKAGFQVLGEIAAPQHHSTQVTAVESAEPTSYYPLFLLATFLIGLVSLIELRMGGLVWSRAKQNFMGAFFITFSFFKLLDLRGFADSYRMYDVVAKRFPVYALIYPIIELALGVAYVTGLFPFATNVVTLAVMSISSIGVIQSLLSKRKIRCACLGAVFNLPMSTVTLVEDAIMVVMAAATLLQVPHGP